MEALSRTRVCPDLVSLFIDTLYMAVLLIHYKWLFYWYIDTRTSKYLKHDHRWQPRSHVIRKNPHWYTYVQVFETYSLMTTAWPHARIHVTRRIVFFMHEFITHVILHSYVFRIRCEYTVWKRCRNPQTKVSILSFL